MLLSGTFASNFSTALGAGLGAAEGASSIRYLLAQEHLPIQPLFSLSLYFSSFWINAIFVFIRIVRSKRLCCFTF
jgi:hypothetical protein